MIQLSQERKIYSKFFFPFSKFRFNFAIFQKKDDLYSLNLLLNLRTPEKVVR